MHELIAQWALTVYIFMKGDNDMMAMLFAQRVILGKCDFDAVPARLKAQAAEILLDSGMPELVPEEYRK